MSNTPATTQLSSMTFARFSGPGTSIYPSPRPADVRDLVLPAMKWIQVDPAFFQSGIFNRDRNKKVFECVEASASPDDLDLSLDAALERVLNEAQKELIRAIVLTPGELSREYASAIQVANHVSDTGIPNQNSSVTTRYLRENHRPFLQGLLLVEKRFRKRKSVIALAQKQLDRIEKMPS